MIVIIGALIVFCSVIGGFCMAGGNASEPAAPVRVCHYLRRGRRRADGDVAPRKVLVDLVKMTMATLKGAPHSREAYNDLFKALYELFMLGRRGGMVALEEHVMNPETSNIFAKYPTFQKETKAMEFLCNGLRPIIDGKIKPDHLKMLLEIELEAMEEEHDRPVSVLTKVADAMPGFGIVAAVLGIVLTMSAISGPIEQIGEKVGAALVGTFLGIFVSYGFMNPLAANIEFMNLSEMAYIRCIAASVIGFAGGMSPDHGGGSRPARTAQRSQTQRGRTGDHAQGAEPGAAGQIKRTRIYEKKGSSRRRLEGGLRGFRDGHDGAVHRLVAQLAGPENQGGGGARLCASLLLGDQGFGGHHPQQGHRRPSRAATGILIPPRRWNWPCCGG